jgi:hypothetical protein
MCRNLENLRQETFTKNLLSQTIFWLSMSRFNQIFALILILFMACSSVNLISVITVSAQTPTSTPSPTPTASPSPSPLPPITPPPSSLLFTTPTPTVTPTPLPTPTPAPDVSPNFKPPVPEFTLNLVNHPIDIPATTPTYTTDPYTGETKLQSPGSAEYMIDNWTIELWIPNKQFNDPNGSSTFHLYYDVRTKGHFEQNWRDLYAPFYSTYDSKAFIPNGSPSQSNKVYTVITYSAYFPPYYSYPQVSYPPNAQVDFQVSALLGHDSEIFVNDHPLAPYPIGHEEPATAYDIQSDWGATQTLTISNSSLSSSTPQNPTVSTPFSIPVQTQTFTPTPTTVPELSWVAIFPMFLVMFAVALLVKHRKTVNLRKP